MPPRSRSADELHDLSLDLVAIRPVEPWAVFAERAATGPPACRATTGGSRPSASADESSIGLEDDVAADCVRGHLQHSGPVTIEALVAEGAPPPAPRGPASLPRASHRPRRVGGAGLCDRAAGRRWCARHLLVRMPRARASAAAPARRAGRARRLCGLPPRWQRVEPREPLRGACRRARGHRAAPGHRAARRATGSQRCFPRASRAMTRCGSTSCASPARSRGCGSRLDHRTTRSLRGAATPSAATPLALVRRDDLAWLLRAVRLGRVAVAPAPRSSLDLLEALERGGAQFRAELAARRGVCRPRSTKGCGTSWRAGS